MKEFTMLPSITENEELPGSSWSPLHEFDKHFVSLTVFNKLGNHIGHRYLSISHRGWWIPIVWGLEGNGEHLNLPLILSLNCEERGSHEPVKYFGESIFSFWGCWESKDMSRAQFKKGLTKYLSTYVMCFIHDECTDALKICEGVFLEGEWLKHRNNKVTFHLLLILLNHTNGSTWTKLLDTLPPLVCQELFVYNNHRSVSQFTGYSQGYRRLPIATW